MSWKAYLRAIFPEKYHEYIEELNTILQNPDPTRNMLDDEMACNRRWHRWVMEQFKVHGWINPAPSTQGQPVCDGAGALPV